MTNEKWVNAPISKIVEAIMAKVIGYNTRTEKKHGITEFIPESRTKDIVQTALASLGGEESKGEWRVFETSTALGDTGDYMRSTGITNGENTLIFEEETDEDGVLIRIVEKLNTHPSEREVLMPKISNVTIISKQYCQSCGEPVTKIDIK